MRRVERLGRAISPLLADRIDARQPACDGKRGEPGALLRRHDSPRKRARLAAFRKAAQPYANTTQIKDFDAEFGDLLRPIPV